VFSTPQPAHGLDIHNGAATERSLRFMAMVALLGVPLVLAYTATVYWIFRGKVTLTDESS
jgi:cytochrome d ubiquinol oxidase subunit II